MVVGTDSVHTKEYSHVNQKLSENTNCQDSNTLYLPGILSLVYKLNVRLSRN